MAEPGKSTPIVRRIVTGLVTLAPLAVTWIILSFLFQQLAQVGRPPIVALSRALQPQSPLLADIVANEILQSALAFAIVIVGIYILGWLAERIAGQRLIRWLDGLASRIPLVKTIYHATRRFLEMASASEADKPRRVVLINFPSREMKTVGLLTQQMRDASTGEELAVVYVPTTPNPTSGYLEILPLKDLVITDWTFDQAMAFIVTAGSNAPETVDYGMPPATP